MGSFTYVTDVGATVRAMVAVIAVVAGPFVMIFLIRIVYDRCKKPKTINGWKDTSSEDVSEDVSGKETPFKGVGEFGLNPEPTVL